MDIKYTDDKELNEMMNLDPPKSFWDWNCYYGMRFGETLGITLGSEPNMDELLEDIKGALKIGIPLDANDYDPPVIEGRIY